MEMTIETIIKDCEQSIKQSELFIKAHQKHMEIGEIKEYQYYIERDKLTIETMRKYQKMQANYENRLKADMVAMLTEIQLEIEELDTYDIERIHGLIENAYVTEDVNNVIQQKIDELKGEDDDKAYVDKSGMDFADMPTLDYGA